MLNSRAICFRRDISALHTIWPGRTPTVPPTAAALDAGTLVNNLKFRIFTYISPFVFSLQVNATTDEAPLGGQLSVMGSLSGVSDAQAIGATANATGQDVPEPKRQICFDFTKNQCSRGASCKFSHNLDLIIQVNSQEKGICFDFLKGTCSRGPLCRFSHDLRNLQAAPVPQPMPNGVPVRPTAPICYDFVKNQCNRGSECRYSHDYASILLGPRPPGKNPNVMCMDYVRGRCTRGASCRYAHMDPSHAAYGQMAAAAAAAAATAVSTTPGAMLAAAGLGQGVGMAKVSPAQAVFAQAQAQVQAQAQAMMAASLGAANGNANAAAAAAAAIAEELNSAWRQGAGIVTSPTAGGLVNSVNSPTSQDDYTTALLIQIQRLGINNGNNSTSSATMQQLAAASSHGPAIRPAAPMQPPQHAQHVSDEGYSALSLVLMQPQAQQAQQQRVYSSTPAGLEHAQAALNGSIAINTTPLPVSRLLPDHLAEREIPPLDSSPVVLHHQQQQQNWNVPFTHPALAKIKAGTAGIHSGNSNGLGGSRHNSSGGFGSQSATPLATGGAMGTTSTDSPTIRAAWGDTGLDMYTTAPPSSQSSSLGVSPRDSLSALTSQESSGQRYGCSLPGEQPGYEALKSIWSTTT